MVLTLALTFVLAFVVAFVLARRREMRLLLVSSALVAGFAFTTGGAGAAPAYGCLTLTERGSGALRLADPAAGEAACSRGETRIAFGFGIDWRGPWSVSATYDVGDVVSYSGSSYIAVKKNKAKRPVPTGYWQMLAQKGDDGPAGAKGDQGLPGAKGEQGVAGPAGPQGPIGPQGPDGAQGPAGPEGPQGLQGLQGPQGAQGETGAPGAPGAAGSAPVTAFASIRHELAQRNIHLRFDLLKLAARQVDYVCFVSGAGFARSLSSPQEPTQPLDQGELGRADILSIVNAGGATGEIAESGSGFYGAIFGHGGSSGPNFSTVLRFRWRAGHELNLKYNFWRFSANSYTINASASVMCFPRNADNEW